MRFLENTNGKRYDEILTSLSFWAIENKQQILVAGNELKPQNAEAVWSRRWLLQYIAFPDYGIGGEPENGSLAKWC